MNEEVKVEDYVIPEDEEEFKEKLTYSYDLKNAYFQLDVLQEKMLEGYVRTDPKFRRAFFTDYTPYFWQFLRDKARLKEPLFLTTMGNVRSSKSYSMISVLGYWFYQYHRRVSIPFICANKYEFLETISAMPENKLRNSMFLIDEDKLTHFGVGSNAQKLKSSDVQNIVAKFNISTISINPTKFANTDAWYGLRAFGREFSQKVNRFMLYNTSESSTFKPLGMVYLPPFYPNYLPYAEELKKEYDVKKDAWILGELKGKSDSNQYKYKKAKEICENPIYQGLKGKNEKTAFISYLLGSEIPKTEVEEIFFITRMIGRGDIKIKAKEEKLEEESP